MKCTTNPFFVKFDVNRYDHCANVYPNRIALEPGNFQRLAGAEILWRQMFTTQPATILMELRIDGADSFPLPYFVFKDSGIAMKDVVPSIKAMLIKEEKREAAKWWWEYRVDRVVWRIWMTPLVLLSSTKASADDMVAMLQSLPRWKESHFVDLSS